MSDAANKGTQLPEVERQAGELSALRRMLLASRGTFSLSVAVCNSPALRDPLIARLGSDTEGLRVVKLPEKTEDVYALLCEETTDPPPSALFVTNLEKSVPSSDRKPVDSPTLRRLNSTRELWKQQHPYPVVFWVPEYVATMFATVARDLWAWRSHQFEFVSEPVASTFDAISNVPADLSISANLDVERKRFRIAELEQRVADAGSTPPPSLAPHVGAWLTELGHLFQLLGDLDRAEEMHRKALEIAEKLGHRKNMGASYGNLGNTYYTRGDLDEAEKLYRKALEIDEKIGRLEGMAITYGNLGVIYRTRGDLDRAEEMHRKALEIAKKLGYREGMAGQYGNLGNVYRTRGDLDRAEEMYRKALDIAERLGHFEGMATNYGNLGLVCKRRGDLDGAEGMFRESLKISEKHGYLEVTAAQYGNLGVIFETRGDLSEACRLWTRARDLFQQIGMPHKVEKTQGMLDEIEGK